MWFEQQYLCWSAQIYMSRNRCKYHWSSKMHKTNIEVNINTTLRKMEIGNQAEIIQLTSPCLLVTNKWRYKDTPSLPFSIQRMPPRPKLPRHHYTDYLTEQEPRCPDPRGKHSSFSWYTKQQHEPLHGLKQCSWTNLTKNCTEDTNLTT
jgi:hypothetical protein